MEEDELMSEFDGGDNEIEMGTDGQEIENIEMEKLVGLWHGGKGAVFYLWK